MRRTTIALLFALAPVALAAQSQPPEQTDSKPTSGFSAEARVRLEAMLQAAKDRQLPTGLMLDRMAEGQAKGASEAQIIAATARAEAQLQASQAALIRAGHSEPSDAQVEQGAELIARGASSAQLEAVARGASSEHRLQMAFEVLTNLAVRGVPVDQALAVIGARLEGSAGGQTAGAANSNPPGLGLGVSGTATGQLGVGLSKKP